VAERDTRRIAHDLLGEPHVHGRRVSVQQLTALVETRGEDPAVVAERFDLDLADVSRALAAVGAGMRDRRDGAERAARRLLQDPTCVWRSSRTSAAWPSGSAIAGS